MKINNDEILCDVKENTEKDKTHKHNLLKNQAQFEHFEVMVLMFTLFLLSRV